MAGEDIKEAKFSVPMAIVVAGLIIGGAIFLSRRPIDTSSASPTPKPVKLSITDEDHVLGDPDAKVTIFEFSDFQCPFCRSFFSGAYKDIKREYIDTGKVKLVYRHLPLSFHKAARPAAIAAECAGKQGKFWEMHDAIFGEQVKMNPEALTNSSALRTLQFTEEDLASWAKGIGIRMDEYAQCVESGEFDDLIDENIKTANSVGAEGTPTFAINGVLIVGARPFEDFKISIEAALK